MYTSSLARLVALCALLCLSSVSAIPVRTTQVKKPTFSAPIRGPKPPHFIAYSDQSLFGIPNAKDLEGFNRLILAFLLADGPADQADAWTHLSGSQRASLKADYKANNITLLVSAFGSTESPTTDGKDPTEVAERMATWVKDNDMDGIDVDYEDFKAVSKGTAVTWLETFTKVLRKNLPEGDFVITHAPVAPWFGPGQPYARLNESVGDLIDWYNVQFYSQGTAYTSCDTLVHESGGAFPGTALLEIVKAGIPQEKVVMGKPANAAAVGVPVGGGGGGGGTPVAGGGGGGGTQIADGGTEVASGGGTEVASGGTQVASGGGGTQVAEPELADRDDADLDEKPTDKGCRTKNAKGGGDRDGDDEFTRRSIDRRDKKLDPHINGFLETDTLSQCVLEAKNEGWNAGVMVWEFPQADKKWIQDVRSAAWPYKEVKKKD